MSDKTTFSDLGVVLLAGCLGTAVALAILAPLTIIVVALQAFVLQQLWTWFVIPTFHLTALSIPTAIGLILILRIAKGDNVGYVKPFEEQSKAEKQQSIQQSIGSLLSPLFILFVGWLVKSMF